MEMDEHFGSAHKCINIWATKSEWTLTTSARAFLHKIDIWLQNNNNNNNNNEKLLSRKFSLGIEFVKSIVGFCCKCSCKEKG